MHLVILGTMAWEVPLFQYQPIGPLVSHTLVQFSPSWHDVGWNDTHIQNALFEDYVQDSWPKQWNFDCHNIWWKVLSKLFQYPQRNFANISFL
jgi:hypothetical protein